MKKIILLLFVVIFSCDVFAQTKIGEKKWISFLASAQYVGMLCNDVPLGDGVLTFKWSKNKIEKIEGTFNGNVKGGGTVHNAKVDLIPEGCHYTGSLSYEIQMDSKNNKLVLKFISGILTLNSRSYKVRDVIYISDGLNKKYSLRDSESNSTLYLRAERIDENELVVDFTDFLAENFSGKNTEQLSHKKMGKPIELYVEKGKKTISVIKERIIEEQQKTPTSKISSIDDEIIIHYNSSVAFMQYHLSDASDLVFWGNYESPNSFKVKKLTIVRLTLNDNTKIEGKKEELSDINYSGKIYYDNGDIFQGDFNLNFNKYNSISDFCQNLNLSDIILEEGNLTKKNGDVVICKSQNVLAREEAERKVKAEMEKKALQKLDSIWNSIPLKKYSGPYQLTADESSKEGYATYFYKVEDDKRVYDKNFNYRDNSIIISGQYKKGMKDGRWIYELKNPNLKLEVDYKNGQRNGIYKCIIYDKNGNLTLNMTLKMKNNFVVGINFWKAEMPFSYNSKIYIKNAQIKAVFSSSGRLSDICEITTTVSDAGKFKYYEEWSSGFLLGKYYYNNMTGDKIELERSSAIVDCIRDIISEVFALTEKQILRGFDEISHGRARNLYYFHIQWQPGDQGSTVAPEWDANDWNYYETLRSNE